MKEENIGREGQRYAEYYDGKRVTALDEAGIGSGWGVSRDVPEGFWDKIATAAIPLVPRKSKWSFVDRSIREAKKELQYCKEMYGENVFIVLIPNIESENGWSVNPVLPEDLEKDISEIVKEHEQALQNQDLELATIKRHVFMLRTGIGTKEEVT
ncbi:MAG: hypothetical protein ACOX6V_01340 [Patescibacteria group bacterium]|jgi:hypothetical protein